MTVPFMPDGTRSDVSLHVRSLLAEDRAEQLLFRGELGLSLRGHLADEDVARRHGGADEHDPRLVELSERALAHVRDVGGDLLHPELGVAGHAHELLDVNGGEAVLLDHALGDEDGILEVVAVPGHERDEHVLPERELAEVRRRAVRQHVAPGDDVPGPDQGALVDAGVLVRALVLGQVVDVDPGLFRLRLVVVHPHHDSGRVHRVDHPAAPGDDRDPRVARDDALHPGADEGLLRAQGRHRLALHVRPHERAVRVVVLQERDEGRRHRNDLPRRHVHVLDPVGRGQGELVAMPAGHEIVDEPALVVERRVGLGDDVLPFLDRREVLDVFGHPAVRDPPVGGLDEAVLVGPGVDREGVDEPDVRALRGLDGTHPPVVGRMDVADLEAGPAHGSARPGRGRRCAACASPPTGGCSGP